MLIIKHINDHIYNQVLRVALSYKRIVSLDGWFEHMLLPYKLFEFVNVFVGEVRSNVNLSEWVRNKVNNLDETFSASVSVLNCVHV